ncbi:MAG: zinc ABC transporter substrate-binding protein [Fibrobacter sp.]|nr:zinc ABC transporter substrate-binding protein [Fibrobacter sp.]
MKNVKKFGWIFGALSLVLFTIFFVGCNDTEKVDTAKGKKLSVVTTIYPEYAWVKEILGARVDSLDLVLLVKNGMDLHSFNPSAKDIATIANADVVVYVGGESDQWVAKALAATPKAGRVALNLMELLGDRVKEEEVVEGMEHEHEHAEEHEHEHAEEHGEEAEEVENDEHVWLSLKNAEILVRQLAEAVAKLDTAHAAEYHMNAALYIARISALDAQYRAMVDSASFKTILFGDRFPFRYLVDDYGIKYFAAFVGCSAESEASFETVAFLAGKMDSLALPAIFTIDGSNGKIARAILDASKKSKDAQVLKLNSMQSVTDAQMQAGADYLSMMQSNLEILKKALK